MLFRNFDVKGPGDRLLIYLILYISACLQREPPSFADDSFTKSFFLDNWFRAWLSPARATTEQALDRCDEGLRCSLLLT